MNKDLQYTLAENMSLILRSHALRVFRNLSQNSTSKHEAGGQLFGFFEEKNLIVDLVTTPKKEDFRSRFSFRPNRFVEQKEIHEHFSHGLHYLGDWHTHPQDIPKPSKRDILSIEECTRKSKHELDGFIMVIVGNTPPPEGLFVCFSDGNSISELELQT